MAKSAPKPDAALARQVEAAALAQLQPSASAQPSASGVAKAWPSDWGKMLAKVIKAVAPGVIQGVFAAGQDGSFTPAEIAAIVADTVRKILELRNQGIAPTPVA